MPRKKSNPAENETKRKLLVAGLAEFHAHGFHGTGVDQVAKSANVPKGSFYNHFESKHAFGAEVVDCYFERHLVKLRHFLLDLEVAPLQRLENYFDERVAFFAERGCRNGCLMGNLSLELADTEERVRERLADRFAEWSLMFRECLAQAQDAGQINAQADIDSLADFVLNSWEGAILRMKVERSTAPLETARRLIFTSILR
ncbi:TetR family transcriptional regulator [Variovorax sp. WS11]|uniref:TetR/AcrR family transcriptional regulator n=1 Tax=Variovorax sp. WS11 TaxID=1105204 RepID=UPI000D0D7F00|nr:TetR/AcrR family transcriptional regulator [Variovorax sp. WS11]NDZ17632.1 TetR family transcriptional regulator [Variovorax sp. WS11]PSL79584.1 TetR family transcriptional regulator [Variovorax sp. WS11]